MEVTCRAQGDAHECQVRVGPEPGATSHTVTVSAATRARLAPAGTSPEELVRAAFEFLLEREPREAILRAFDLPVIGRYFSDYEAGIRAHLEGPTRE